MKAIHAISRGEARQRLIPTPQMRGSVMSHDDKKRGRVARRAAMMTGAAALAFGVATPAFASTAAPAVTQASRSSAPSVELVSVTPRQGGTAGSGGVFNVDLVAQARNAAGDKELSAANGYEPGIADLPPGVGEGHPDPYTPGLVLLLSTTPSPDGGADANVMGAFQLTDVAKTHNLNQVIADWETRKPGAFGTPGTKVTLTAYVVSGTAPGIVTGKVRPISNVVHETFWVGK